MTDTVYCDVSQFQPDANNAYPYAFIAIRSNDGTFDDTHFQANIAWSKLAVQAGRLFGFIATAVYEPGVDWVGRLKANVGTVSPHMAVMVDVESWGGKITGNHSADINTGVAQIMSWLGSSSRVLGYGNVGDLNGLWPTRNLVNTHLVVADYGAKPNYPGLLVHQYSDAGNVAPFGSPVDMNSADGLSPDQFCAALGLPLPGQLPTNPIVTSPITTGEETMLFARDEHGDIYAVDFVTLQSRHLTGPQWAVAGAAGAKYGQTTQAELRAAGFKL